MLALFAQIRHRGLSRPHQLTHGFVAGIRNPDGRQFAGPVQPSQGQGIPAVVFTRSPGRFGISEGAMTAQSCPSAVI
jgi:hypothetical protein